MNFVNTIILGPTGAGKSTLGNLLLYGIDEVEGGFVVGHGSHSATMECHQKVMQVSNEHFLQVIDTPGVPDTDPNKTLRGYDKIIKHVRRSPSVNAIIILVTAGRVEARDYRNYRTLLRQFNALPCPKIMVCRVDIKESWSVQRKNIKYTAAKELMDNIERQAELKNVERFILHDTNEDDAQVLREIVCNMPSTDLAPATLRTYKEIKLSYERLSKINMRRSELEAEVNRLGEEKRQNERAITRLRNSIHSLERKKTGMSGFAVVASATLIALPFAIFGFSRVSSYDRSISIMKTEERAAESRVATLRTEITAKEAEIRSGYVDPTELQSVKAELEQLESLKN